MRAYFNGEISSRFKCEAARIDFIEVELAKRFKKKEKYPAGYRIRINAFVVLDLLLAVDGELNVARM